MDSSNKRKARLLGAPGGTAANKLRKMILFHYVQCVGHDYCFRCNSRIETVDDLSIEHKTPWQSAPDPKAAFFDLENIAFSHLRCNSGHTAIAQRTNCPKGHPYSGENLAIRERDDGKKRECRTCQRIWSINYYRSLGTEGPYRAREYRRKKKALDALERSRPVSGESGFDACRGLQNGGMR